MSTKRRISRKSTATKVQLEKLSGGPLTLGLLLEAIRLGEEISQVDFARKLGISKSHLCDIEKDRKNLSPAKAAEYAKVLGYSESQFVRLALQGIVRRDGLTYRVSVEAA